MDQNLNVKFLNTLICCSDLQKVAGYDIFFE